MRTRRIIYVFPVNYVFDEIRSCFARAAERLGDMVVCNDYNDWTPARSEWYDPANAIVFWCNLPWVVPENRKAKCVFHYVESAGDPSGLIPIQRHWFEIHRRRALEADLFLVGNPAMQDFWNPLAKRVALTPIGYDAEIMGVPDWSKPKLFDVGFCGTEIGRRLWILPALRKRFGNRYTDIRVFGKARNEAFNSCRLMLYVGHSPERSFPDLRLWSAAATSALLVTESRDAWPAIPGRHYIELDPALVQNPDLFVDSVERELKNTNEDLARVAHRELSAYTVERCMREFSIPAIEALP